MTFLYYKTFNIIFNLLFCFLLLGGTVQQNVMDHLMCWLNNLPTVPSHYCRKTSTYKDIKFLPEGTTLNKLYKDYCASASSENIRYVSIAKFNNIFHENKFSVHRPRKDQCDKCIAAKFGNLASEEHQRHLKEKDWAQLEKNNDKTLSQPTTSVWTMDLQCVLLCPTSGAGSLYYKQKLQVHNFTLYNLKTKEGYCYVWSEIDGDLSSEMFAFLQYNHFNSYLRDNNHIKELIIYSDGCGYQNRNTVVSNMYLSLSMESNVTIVQKYLVSGHTEMECDSMHSVIQRKMVSELYHPREYLLLMQSARSHPFPYKVKEMKFNGVMKMSKHHVNSIRPGKKSGDPVVHDLRALKYTPSGSIPYKLSLNSASSWENLPQRIHLNINSRWISCFLEPVRIKKKKILRFTIHEKCYSS